MSQQTALARPPFAIDDADTKYVEHTPSPRQQPRSREERAKVSESTYDAYNNYLGPDSSPNHLGPNSNGSQQHRPQPSTDSTALGNGLFAALAAANDSDDDSDDDTPSPPKRPTHSPTSASVSKNQALFEAAVSENMSPAPPAYEERGQPRPAMNEKGGRGGPSPQPPRGPGPAPNLLPHQQNQRGPSPTPSITPPPPAAPLQVHIPAHQMNAPQPKRVITAGDPHAGPGPMQRGPPQPLTINPPHPAMMMGPGGMGGGGPMTPGGPGFHMNPTPIPATSTPIQPAFIKPIKPVFIKPEVDGDEKSPSVMSHESSMPIMRGEKEDYLPLRSGQRIPRVGQKRVEGDDFWRRFSMVVKENKAKPAGGQSEWLQRNTRSGRSYSRWVWCIGIFALLIIVGGSVAIWWFTRGNPDHAIPVVIGREDEGGAGGAGAVPAVQTVPTPIGQGGAAATSTAVKGGKEEVVRKRSKAVRHHKKHASGLSSLS